MTDFSRKDINSEKCNNLTQIVCCNNVLALVRYSSFTTQTAGSIVLILNSIGAFLALLVIANIFTRQKHIFKNLQYLIVG